MFMRKNFILKKNGFNKNVRAPDIPSRFHEGKLSVFNISDSLVGALRRIL